MLVTIDAATERIEQGIRSDEIPPSMLANVVGQLIKGHVALSGGIEPTYGAIELVVPDPATPKVSRG